jgi:5-methyltetrahydrofolate--homocysteine methyltransferase
MEDIPFKEFNKKMDHEVLKNISLKLEALDLQGTIEEVKKALDERIPPFEIVKNGLSPGMDKIGEKYERKEYFLSELSFAAHIMKGAMELLGPQLKASKKGSLGTFLIGTVKGDLHDIGKNIVSMMLTSAGFEVYDLGIDVADEKFLQKTVEIKADFVGMSSLLTTTMPSIKSVIELFKNNGIREKVKIFVGGAVVTQSFADEIGADCYARDAMECVRKARNSIASGK